MELAITLGIILFIGISLYFVNKSQKNKELKRNNPSNKEVKVDLTTQHFINDEGDNPFVGGGPKL